MDERDITPPLSPRSSDAHSLWRSGSPLGRRGRAALVVVGLLLLAGFLLAASVAPDPRGFGTHQRLGFPPCTFLLLFQIPCPSCGMTTAFAHFVRLEWLDAARANAAGLFLALLCALLIPWCGISAAVGRTWLCDRPEIAFFWMTSIVVAVCLVQWGVRLAT